jgi:hypothetical protein
MAVVGNVGTYATVQPIEGPNFGGMVQAQFDKLDAERKAKEKRKEEAKAKKQAQLDKLSLPEQEMLNINGLQDQRYNWYKSKVPEFVALKEAGDYNGMQRLITSLETEANAVKQTNAKLKQYYDNRVDYDDDYFRKFEDLTKYVNSGSVDLVDKGDGELRYNIYKDPEKKELLYENITPYEYVSKTDVPLKFDSTKEAGMFAKTFKLDEIDKEIDSKSKYGTIQVKDLMDNDRVLSRINDKAEEYINDDRAMAHFGKRIDKWEARAKNYTEEEKKEAKDYFTKLLKDAYQQELELRISQKSQGGSGGSKSGGFNIVQSTLEIPKTYSLDNASVAYGSKNADGTSKTDVNMPAGSISFNVAKEGGVSIIVGDRKLNDIVYDPNSKKMIFALSTSASSRQGAGSGGANAVESESNKESSWFTERDLSFEQLKNSLNTIPSLRGRIKTKNDIVQYVLGIQEKKVDENL